MARKAVKRRYSFSDSALGQLGSDIIAFAKRDKALFAGYGYDDERIAGVEAMVAAFKAFPNDEYFTGLLMVATRTKNEAVKAVSDASSDMVKRATIKFGADSPQARSFAYKGYAGLSDAGKMSVNHTVHAVATKLLPGLESMGVTQAMLDELKSLREVALEAIADKALSMGARDIAVGERIALGNAVYAEVVKMAGTGKAIFAMSDESRYNDYVIYESEQGVNTVTGKAPAHSVHAPGMEVAKETDKIKISVTKGKLQAYCGSDPTGEPGAEQVTYTVTAKNPFTGTAAALGWTKENYRLLLKNAGGNDVPFSVVVRE